MMTAGAGVRQSRRLGVSIGGWGVSRTERPLLAFPPASSLASD
jgi:hypothetical protein